MGLGRNPAGSSILSQVILHAAFRRYDAATIEPEASLSGLSPHVRPLALRVEASDLTHRIGNFQTEEIDDLRLPEWLIAATTRVRNRLFDRLEILEARENGAP